MSLTPCKLPAAGRVFGIHHAPHMFDFIKPSLYVRLSPARLTVRNTRTGAFISGVPEIAFVRGPKLRILGTGDDAAAFRSVKSAQIVNPFTHPRSLVSDFVNAEQVLKAFVRKATGKGLLAAAPRVLFHPLGEPTGGFTQVEVRAFHEMMLGAGASEVVIWQGPDLTDQQVTDRHYPATGSVLE